VGQAFESGAEWRTFGPLTLLFLFVLLPHHRQSRPIAWSRIRASGVSPAYTIRSG